MNEQFPQPASQPAQEQEQLGQTLKKLAEATEDAHREAHLDKANLLRNLDEAWKEIMDVNGMTLEAAHHNVLVRDGAKQYGDEWVKMLLADAKATSGAERLRSVKALNTLRLVVGESEFDAHLKVNLSNRETVGELWRQAEEETGTGGKIRTFINFLLGKQ
ncbi:MAG: hypothetical protein WC250_00985 [Candidatus Paceibacterota bacterium]